jgi:hypothetical protein
VLTTQLLTKPPAEWNIGVSLSTPAPTNAAAMPAMSKKDSSDGGSDNGEEETAPLTENDFFKVRDTFKRKESTKRDIPAELSLSLSSPKCNEGSPQHHRTRQLTP